jgi:hypothetical protein
MRSHSQILKDATEKPSSAAAVARDIGGEVVPQNVIDWRRRDFIPAERWLRLVELGLATYEELAAHAAARAAQSQAA